MADLGRGQSPAQKHKENAAQLAELNEAIKKHTAEQAEMKKEAMEQVEEKEDLADKEVREVLGDDQGYAPYGTPEYYEREYVKQLPPPLRKLISPEAREEVAEQVKSLDIGDILLAQAEQTVPIIRGSLYATFRVLTTDEEICVEDMIADSKVMSQKQALSAINVFRLAVSMVGLADDRMPEHRKSDGTIDKDVVMRKIAKIKQQANPITMLLTCHLGWFDRRVYAALAGESLKNG
jgi:hypothetical protein